MSLNEGSKNQDLKNKLNEAKEGGLETKEIVSLMREKIEAILGKQNNPDAPAEVDSSKTEKSPDQIKQALDTIAMKVEGKNAETDSIILSQIHEELSNFIAMHPDSYQELTQGIDQALAEKNKEKPSKKLSFADLLKERLGEKDNNEKREQDFKAKANKLYEQFTTEKELIVKALEEKNLIGKKEELQGNIRVLEEDISTNFNQEELVELYGIISVLYPEKSVEELKELDFNEVGNMLNLKQGQIEELIPGDQLEDFNKLRVKGLDTLKKIQFQRIRIKDLNQAISILKPDHFSDEVVLAEFLNNQKDVDLSEPNTAEKLKEIFKEQNAREEKEKNYPKLVQKISSRIVFDKNNLVRESYYKLNRESEKTISKLKNDFNEKQQALQDRMTFDTYRTIFDIWGYQQGGAIKFNPRDVERNLAKDEELKDDPRRRTDIAREIYDLESEARELNQNIQNEHKKIDDNNRYLSVRKNEELREQDLEVIAKILEPEIPEGKYEDLREALKKELKCGWAKEPFIGFARRLDINQAPGYSGYTLESEVKELGTELLQKIAKINDNDEKESIINSWKEKVLSACSPQEGKAVIKDEAAQANLNKLLDSIVFLAKKGNLDLNQVNRSNYLLLDQSFDYFNQSFNRDYYSIQELDDVRKQSKLIKEEQANFDKHKDELKKYNLTENELQKSLDDRKNIESEQYMLKELMRSSNIDKESLNKFISKYNERFGENFSKAGLFSNPSKVFESIKAEAESKYENLSKAIDDYSRVGYIERSIENHQNYKLADKEKFIKKVLGNFIDLSNIKEKMYYLLSQGGQAKFNKLSVDLNDSLRRIAEEIAEDDDLNYKDLSEKIKGMKEAFTIPLKDLIETEIYSSSDYKKYIEIAEQIKLIRSVKSFKDLEVKQEETT